MMRQQPASKSTQLRNWFNELRDVRWVWLLGLSVGVQFTNLLFIGILVSILAIFLTITVGGAPPAEPIIEFSAFIGGIGGPIFQLILTALAAYWLVRRVGTAVAWHGILLGVFTGLEGFLVAVLFSEVPLSFFDLGSLLFFGLHILLGWLGAMRGQSALAGREKLYYTSQAVGRANQPQAIVNAIGHHLAGADVVQIGLWDVLLQDQNRRPTAVSLQAIWSATPDTSWQTGLELDQNQLPALIQLQQDEALLFKSAQDTDEATLLLADSPARSALILPLVSPSGSWEGVLTLTSRASSGFSRSNVRDYETIGAQVALVLENMRLLVQAQETAVLHERQRLAREIHDTLAQGFTSIVMNLETAEQALPDDLNTVQHSLDQARLIARNSLTQARRVVDDLRPEVLESTPLDEAIQRVVKIWSGQSGVQASVTVTGKPHPLHPQVEVTLLRATQEALANVRKHAQAHEVCVTLSYLDDLIILDVQDDGVGLIEKSPLADPEVGGYGLIAMRERITQLGGNLLIESDPSEGTTLVASIPVASNS